MKFTLKQKDLTLSSKALAKTLNRHPHLPVLAGIFLKTNKNFLELTTTDLTAGVKVKIPAQIEEEGETIVNGKIFLETVGFFDQAETKFLLKEKELSLNNGADKVLIPLVTQEYPDFSLSKKEGEEITLDFWEIIQKKVAFTASSDQTRPALTGVLFTGEGNLLQTVCTDGFRLTVLSQELSDRFFHEKNLILSARAINDVVALLQNFEEEKVSFVYDEAGAQIFFINNSFTYFTKLINSNYPPFEKIIPLEFMTKVKADRLDLIKNLNKAAIFARTSNNVVKLEIKNKKIHFLANSLGDGVFESEQELIEQTGENLKIAFNIRYLSDFLSLASNDVVSLGFNGHDKPVLITDLDNSKWQYVVMPFKPKG